MVNKNTDRSMITPAEILEKASRIYPRAIAAWLDGMDDELFPWRIPANLKLSDVLLAIEVGDASWRYDTETKAALYAAHGVQEYWAINALTRTVRVHSGPGASGWSEVREVAAGAIEMEALCTPGNSFSLTI